MQNPYSADQYPDLSLAMTPSYSPDTLSGGQTISSGSSLTHMPPIPMPSGGNEQPVLHSSDPGMVLTMMGISPDVPYYDLALADTPDLAYEQYPQAKDPTFTAPSMTVPTNRPYDLQAPGIDHVAELSPDPYTGDLLSFDHPLGLSLFAVNQSNPLAGPPDPMLPDTDDYDRPDNLMMPSPMTVDLSLPDLQSPDLEQDVQMSDRPGNMGMSNGTGPDLGPDGDNDDDDGPMPPYDEEYQTPGMSHRQRKQDMRYRGLKGEL